MNKENKPRNTLGKILLTTIAFSAGIFCGEYIEPHKTLSEKKLYANRSIEDDTPKDLFNYTTKISVNEKGRLELYFGNEKTGDFYRVNEQGLLGQERVEPTDTLFLQYRSVEDNTPADFMNYVVEPRINDKGRIELYFGNQETQVFRKVNEDGTVGTLGEKIDEQISGFSEKLKPYTQPTIDAVSQAYDFTKEQIYLLFVKEDPFIKDESKELNSVQPLVFDLSYKVDSLKNDSLNKK
jgi:hypothetical protein